jgi:cytochrome oxidase assembly protein ShyY1
VPVRSLLAPRLWGLHVLAVLATTAAVLLGIWQFDAWAARRDDQAASLANAPAKPLSRVMSADDAFPGNAVGQPVELEGRWLPGSTLYVADRAMQGRRGVWVVTPVEVCPDDAHDASCSGAPAVLVVRGWAPTAKGAPPPPSGAVQVTGWLQPGEGSGVSDPDPTDDVIPELRIADAIQHVDQDLYGGYVIARTVSTGSTTRGATADRLTAVRPASLPEAETFTALRNLLYAVEWWVFGGFAVFLWWRWARDELERQRIVRDGPEDRRTDGPDDEVDPRVSGVTGVPSGQ